MINKSKCQLLAKKLIYSIFVIITFQSCEKVINVDLKNAKPNIVIEGIVNNTDSGAEVKITKSIVFSIDNNYPPVTNATVNVRDNNGNNFLLNQIKPGIYKNNLLKGISGNTYTMMVNVDGNNYKATSTMPPVIKIDSLIQDKITLTRPIVFVAAIFFDPVGLGNAYQFIKTTNGKRDKNLYIIDDQYQDGGLIFNELISDSTLKKNDIVVVEMQCITKPVFRYLLGVQDLQFGQTIPANPESNISNGALGYFSTYTTSKKLITIK